ncbi:MULTISPECIES: preprotein translocase subunit YajC [Caproicibacterium]|uniref:DUF3021 domain-containing protein n=1 Tax=Caproicibacterium argilliputei TaxID=3030016 RepID=A0AA97D6U7_9FIRM|nr:hypothetical protein [Caproicibacterium argilliputei]WOC31655.1 hypothetical protein PXC00_10610 [Caproicibacterium argilliputei]
MGNKKDQFFFILKICITFFAIAMIGAYIYCIVMSKQMFRTEFIGQLLLIDAFLFFGGILGVTDIVIPIHSSKIRIAIVGASLYGLSLYLLSFVSFNPLRDVAKFFAFTFLFVLIVAFVVIIFSTWQKKQSQKYMNCINQFQKEHDIK